MKFKRYQLKKEAIAIVEKGHPWIFRSHLSSAADIFKTGDKLKLVDAKNSTVGYGVYDADGLIAVRILKKGQTEPNVDWMKKQVQKALFKREALRKYTNAFRVIHGENDGFPGVVIEIYRDTLVLQSYTSSMDGIARYIAGVVFNELGAKTLLLKAPQKRVRTEGEENRAVRVLRGTLPRPFKIHEGKAEFSVDLVQGQKSGTFLDLRGLRKYIGQMDLKGKRVLNLFSYTGTLGMMAEKAGARDIWNVDIAKGALDFAKSHHVQDLKRHRFIEADIFHWLEALGAHEVFDLIIVDPPNMGTKKEQVPQIRKTYEKLYRLSVKHLRPGGSIIGCCCTSRIARKEFAFLVDRCLHGMKCIKELKPEDDHPVTFSEGDYLKTRIYRLG